MKKALKIAGRILVWTFVVFAVCIMIFTIVSVTTLNHADRNLFGYKAFVVMSDSMSATDFNAGDVVLVKEVDPETLKEGDIIAFTSTDSSNYGETVTHKIRKLSKTTEGEPAFVTYGTTTNTDDRTLVTYEYVIGKYEFSIPVVGRFFQFLKTTPGYIICIFVPFVVLILFYGLNCLRLFKKYKREQLAEVQSEREKLEEERAESHKLMQELQELKAQLANNSSQEDKPSAESNSDEALKEQSGEQ